MSLGTLRVGLGDPGWVLGASLGGPWEGCRGPWVVPGVLGAPQEAPGACHVRPQEGAM